MSQLFVHISSKRPHDPVAALGADNPRRLDISSSVGATGSVGIVSGPQSSIAADAGWDVAIDGWLADTTEPAHRVLDQLRAGAIDADNDLDGEFAVVARRAGSGVAIRDHAGLRPLYIGQCRDGSWMAASSLLTLVATAAIDLAPNVEALRHLLIAGGLGPSGSPYQNIRTVPSGNLAWLTPGAPPRFERWWTPTRRRSTPADLRRSVERSVSLRMNLSPAIDVECSGGLDSSTIAGLAAVHPQRENATLVGLTSEVAATDERRFQAAVETSTGLPAVWVPVSTTASDPVEQARLTGSLPPYPNGVMWSDLHAARRGMTSIALSGHGGDELFGRLPTDVLRLLRGPGAVAVLRHRDRRHHLRRTAAVIKRKIVPVEQRVPTWVVGPDQRQRHADQSNRLWFLTGDRSALAIEFDHPLTAPFGIQRHYPLLDRTVIETGLRLPPSARSNLDDWRWLQRSLFADVLPAEVAGRTSKGNFNNVYDTHIRNSAKLLAAPRAAELGLVDPTATQLLAADLPLTMTGRELQQRWALIAVEAFLEANDR